MNNHYYRPRQDGTIIKGFSDAFEQPLQTDIFIGQGDRHFHFQAQDENGLYLWAWDGTKKVPANLDLQIDSIKAIKIQELNRIAETEIVGTYPKHKQLNILMLGRDNTTGQAYTTENQVTMREFIDTIRTKLANKEAQVNAATTAQQVGGILW